LARTDRPWRVRSFVSGLHGPLAELIGDPAAFFGVIKRVLSAGLYLEVLEPVV
jgi:hypothetical protein